ncbi:DedA family protein [Nocardia goodfellowii]
MDIVATTNTTELDGVAAWAVDLMERLGGLGAGLAIAAENLFPPLPSEVILPLAGFAAARGEISLVGAIGWTTAGSLIGAIVLYLLGVALGRDRLYAIVRRLPLVHTDDLARSEEWFARHGRKAVLFGRMVPIVRSLVSIPAGVQRMPLGQFVALTALGSTIWNSLFVLAGHSLGANWETVSEYVSRYQLLVLALIALGVAVWFVRRLRARLA